MLVGVCFEFALHHDSQVDLFGSGFHQINHSSIWVSLRISPVDVSNNTEIMLDLFHGEEYSTELIW